MIKSPLRRGSFLLIFDNKKARPVVATPGDGIDALRIFQPLRSISIVAKDFLIVNLFAYRSAYHKRHKKHDSARLAQRKRQVKSPEPFTVQGFSWYARCDSNAWPSESEFSGLIC